MNLMNNLKIGMRIYFIAILLNVLMMIIASIGIIKMGNIGNVLYDIAEIDIPLTRIITQMTVHQLEKAVYFERAMRYATFLTDFQNHTARDHFNSAKESCFKQGRLFNENLEKAMKIPEHALQNAKNLQARQQFKDILDALKSIDKEHHEVENKMKKVFEMIDAKKIDRAEHQADQIEDAEEDLFHTLEELLMNIEKQTETAGKHAEHEEAAGLRTMIWITIIALVLGIFLSLYITKSITRPLIDIVNIAKDIAHGELNKEITIDQRDEIGDLANNFRSMVSRIRDCVKVTMDQSQHIKDGDLKSRCENKGFQGAWKDLTKGINDIVDAFIEPFDVVAQNLNRLSRGDIPDLLDHDYKGDFNEMRNSLNQLIKVLSTIINEIKSGTDVLLDSVQDLTVSSQEISSTSNEQAAAVKEIVSTMEDSDQLAKSVAGKISEVTDRTTSTKDVVNRGFTVIKESLDKMSEIKTANAETITDIKSLGDKVESIWEIVNMINGIADQTKIIAFNAELEASSAGEAGKNFQIVASEIRRLADSTVSSTSEIKAKITEIQQSSDSLIIASEEGTVKITEGWELSNNLKTIFDDILHSADVSATASDQIATSVNQQASAFEQILLTLKQISEGIDNFVISTKSTSEASEKLKEISNNLHTVLENYLGHGDKSNG